jgi:hypothetical protein
MEYNVCYTEMISLTFRSHGFFISLYCLAVIELNPSTATQLLTLFLSICVNFYVINILHYGCVYMCIYICTALLRSIAETHTAECCMSCQEDISLT